MLKPKVLCICTWLLLLLGLVAAQPLDYSNPKSQVEYISANTEQRAEKPNIVPVTRPPLIIDTPPPAPANSKNFAYNPKTQTWTLIKPGDPPSDEGILMWNQSNDKWLSRVPGSLSI